MNRNKLKKNEEEDNLMRFVDIYHEEKDKLANFKLLNINEAKKIYSSYNGENPGFIVEFNGTYIGIEVFELIKNNLSPQVYKFIKY